MKQQIYLSIILGGFFLGALFVSVPMALAAEEGAADAESTYRYKVEKSTEGFGEISVVTAWYDGAAWRELSEGDVVSPDATLTKEEAETFAFLIGLDWPHSSFVAGELKKIALAREEQIAIASASSGGSAGIAASSSTGEGVGEAVAVGVREDGEGEEIMPREGGLEFIGAEDIDPLAAASSASFEFSHVAWLVPSAFLALFLVYRRRAGSRGLAASVTKRVSSSKTPDVSKSDRRR